MDIRQKIATYHGEGIGDPHHRYRSWEHCYGYFRRIGPSGIASDREQAALQLGFYLASWGMLRNSFLMQHAYTVHLGVIDCLSAPEFGPLWEADVGSKSEHKSLVPLILSMDGAVRRAYKPFGKATDTLVTKVSLGTVGCLPALDRFFIEGFRLAGFEYSYFHAMFVDRILEFCSDNSEVLQTEQARIESTNGVRYPFMKLADMYFFQVGYDARYPATPPPLPAPSSPPMSTS